MGMGPEIQSKLLYRCKRVSAFLIDETILQIGTDEAGLWGLNMIAVLITFCH